MLFTVYGSMGQLTRYILVRGAGIGEKEKAGSENAYESEPQT